MTVFWGKSSAISIFTCDEGFSNITIDPQNPEVVYAIGGDAIRSAIDGFSRNSDRSIHSSSLDLYKSIDGGDNWHIVTENFPGVFLRIDPADSQVIYSDRHKSVDGGKTWNLMPSTTVLDQIGKASGRKVYPQIYSRDTKIQYLLTPEGSICKSTNGGSSWILMDNEELGTCRTFVVDPNNSNVLYGYFERKMKDGNGKLLRNIYGKEYGTTGEIFKSSNGGKTWASSLPAVGIAGLMVDPGNSAIIYAITQSNGIYRSLDGGKQWNTINRGLPLPLRQSWFLIIDPVNSETIYTGTGQGVFISSDRGYSWHKFDAVGLPKNKSSYINQLVINPQNPAIMYVGAGGRGIFKTIDGGTTWKLVKKGVIVKNDICKDY